MIGSRRTEIETFESHLQALSKVYRMSLQMNQDAEERIKAAYINTLESNQNTIQALQANNEELKVLAGDMQESAVTYQERTKILEKENENVLMEQKKEYENRLLEQSRKLEKANSDMKVQILELKEKQDSQVEELNIKHNQEIERYNSDYKELLQELNQHRKENYELKEQILIQPIPKKKNEE